MKNYKVHFTDQLSLISDNLNIEVDDDEDEDDAVLIFKHQYGENREIEFVEAMF